MQLQGSRADPAQLERLQSMLSEKNGEIQNLMTKLQRLEKVEVSAENLQAFYIYRRNTTVGRKSDRQLLHKNNELLEIFQLINRSNKINKGETPKMS